MEKIHYQDIALKLAPMLDVLSHPARLQIVLHLVKYTHCPAHSISKRLPLCKSTVSQHMSKLKEAGLITCTPDGVCQNYQLNDKNFALVKKYFLHFFEEIDERKEKRSVCKPALMGESTDCVLG